MQFPVPAQPVSSPWHFETFRSFNSCPLLYMICVVRLVPH